MTDQSYETVQEADAGGQIEPIHVVVDKPLYTEQSKTPEFGSWHTFVLSPTSPAQQILPQNRSRSEAEIIVFGGTGAAAGAYVQFGTQAQAQTGTGGQLQAGTRITYEAAQAVWMAPDGTNAMIVTVLDQRYY